MYATIVNNRPGVSGLIQFYVKSWQRTYIRFGRNTAKWFWIDDWRWSWLRYSARIEGRAIPPGSKMTYSFTVSGKYPEQGGNPVVAVIVGDGEDGNTIDARLIRYVAAC